MIISLDTETTGVDLIHGARPFLVTWCEQGQGPCFMEWDVDPLTRQPEIPEEDLQTLVELIDAADLIYMQNGKFDVRMLAAVGVAVPWEKIRDTLVSGHLLASNHPHNLTYMVAIYLGVDIEPFEVSVKETTQFCRTLAKKHYPEWRLADEGLPEMPSVKGSSKRDEDKPWKNDMWLPRALLKAKVPQHQMQHWGNACSRYACADSEYTLYLGLEHERIVRERGLWDIYMHRMQVAKCYCEMESYGVTAIGDFTESTINTYELHTAEAETALVEIAREYGHDLELASGAALNDNMREFFYGSVNQSCQRCKYKKRVKHWNEEEPQQFCPKCAKGSKKVPAANQKLVTTRKDTLNLPVIAGQKTGNASLDKDAMQEYLTSLEGNAYDFIRLLADKRKYDTAITYMKSYRRFWVPVLGATGYFRIHPSLNPCGTDHLRAASNSPNLQNVGKQEQRCEECDGAGCATCGGSGLTMLSARNCFGPAPGREWYSADFESIENRIPAYECMEPALIEIFEKPNEPPYWGSNHNLLCSLLWPDLYGPIAHIKGEFKKRYINEYKRGKNTNFAKQYGAGKRKVDNTAQVHNAYELIDRGMPKLAELQRHYLAMAERIGYVETLPDRSVDPKRGYPILASRTEDGRVLSTTPFNYHVSGTACQVKNAALIRCSERCAMWRREGFDAHIALEVHDELVFDFPRGSTPDANLSRALYLKKLMAQGGDDLIPPIPTPVSLEYHEKTWAEGVSV